MIEAKDFYDHGLALHGHKCPAMPMVLRVGAAALNALGVERAADGQRPALVELGEDHCATCFADGVQMVTGCTFGKSHARLAGERRVCIPGHAQLTGLREPRACA